MKNIAIFIFLLTSLVASAQTLSEVEQLARSGNFALAKEGYKKLLAKSIDSAGRCSKMSISLVAKLSGVLLATGRMKAARSQVLAFNDCGLTPLLYNILGVSYFRVNADSSIFYYEKALKSDNEAFKANIQNNLGVLYAEKKAIDSSLYYYNQALFYYKGIDSKLGICRSYSNIGRLYRAAGVIDSSVYYFGKCLIINNNKNGYLDNFLALDALVSSAELQRSLKKSLRLIVGADSVIKVIQANISRRSDKLRLLRQSKRVFDLALNVLVDLHSNNKNSYYFNLLFYFSERQKGNILLSQLNVSVLSLSQIQAGLKEGEALIEYFQVPGKVYCFVVTKSKKHLIKVADIDSKVLSDKILRYIRGCNTLGLRGFMTYSPLVYKLLFAKLLPLLSGIKVLTIVPTNDISGVPFESMMMRPAPLSMEGYKGAEYLLKRFVIKYHISATLASLGVKRRYKPGFVGFVHSRFRNGMDSLVNGEQEVVEAQRFYSSSLVLKNDEATPSRLRNLNTKVLHISTHGYYGAQNRDSGLWVKENKKDVVLTVSDLFELKPKAELVILSGCFTAHGRIIDSEGVVGLPYAFALNGSRFVLSSLWLIPEERTKVFMGKFYSYSRRFGYDKALQLAKVDMISTTLPFFWTSFVLSGR